MLFVFIVRDLMVILVMLIFSLFAGMFAFSCELVCEQDGICCLCGVIFFPIMMLGGIGVAFRDMFCETVGELCQDYC